ncbi:winged helix-turn-helix transcriptional regulator [Pseudomonas saxonica]|uniref:Winged helix-turn-helix transcriptional regulator n=2 Tax=Pseudomonas saxonica TaxID=2600598 RepID=A0ABY3GFY7_9PSED|nr:winged helix-turn-helix transcriptional regulator [Pseudomonas saxonica]
MLFSIYRTDIFPPSAISFVQNEALLNHLRTVISPDTMPLGTFNKTKDMDYDLNSVKAVFIEAGIASHLDDSLEIIKQVRTVNQRACIFVLVTHPGTLSNVDYHIAGADYCIKLPGNEQDKTRLLVRALNESRWNYAPVQLRLDRTKLRLCSATRTLELTHTEMMILDTLLRAPHQVMSYEHLVKALAATIVFYDPRALEKAISRLRTKIKNAHQLKLISSVRSFGYRLRRSSVY